MPFALILRFALLTLLLLSGHAQAQGRVALVIGNSAYKVSPLKNPVNDARAVAGRLRELGFETILRENLKTREIGAVYRELRSRITPGSTAVVFYAGHGVQFKGQNYFPAVDSDINNEEEVPLQSLHLGTLLDMLEESKAGISIVLLDACRDNPYARRFRSAARGLARVESASGTLIHYATKPGSVAADGNGRNGTYTEALLAALGESGVPVELMLKKVANRVVGATGGKQEPWMEGGLRGDFYFISPTSGSPGTPVASLQPERARPAPANAASPAPAVQQPPPVAPPMASSGRGGVVFKGPAIAENGAVVPIELAFSRPLQAGESVDISIVAAGERIAVSRLVVRQGTLGLWSLRILMPRSGRVVSMTSRGESSEEEIKVTVGGDPSRLDPLQTASIKQRLNGDDLRILISGNHSQGEMVIAGPGFAVGIAGSPYLARNPLFGFKGSAAGEVSISLR